MQDGNCDRGAGLQIGPTMQNFWSLILEDTDACNTVLWFEGHITGSILSPKRDACGLSRGQFSKSSATFW